MSTTTRRHIGGSILASNSLWILDNPVQTTYGALQVRVIADEDTHGLFTVSDGVLLAKHPNGFSCHCLAERLRDKGKAIEQAQFIVACGGLVTTAGWVFVYRFFATTR